MKCFGPTGFCQRTSGCEHACGVRVQPVSVNGVAMHQPLADWSAIGNAIAILQGTSELPSNEHFKAILERLSVWSGQLDAMGHTTGYDNLQAHLDLAVTYVDDCGPVEAEELSNWALQDALEAREA